MANFTKEQEQAIVTHDKNLIVVAGAGSGKTRVLVERYLDLLDKNRDWRLNQLVAITFTREAAFEMRDRVRQELENKVQHPENEDERRHWSDLLGQMDSARIDTIHGMCATILRANAAEARIDPGFDVLEPIEADTMLSDIIDAELRLLAENDTDNLILLFSEYDMRDIREALANPELLSIDFSDAPTNPDSLMDEWHGQWHEDYLEGVQYTNASLENALNWMPDGGFPPGDKRTEIFQFVNHHWDDFLADDIELSLHALNTMADGINLRGGSAKQWGGKDIFDEAKWVLTGIRDRLRQLRDETGNPPDKADERAAKLLIRWYRLLQGIQNRYVEAKAEGSYLDFDDLETRTAELLRENEAVRQRYQGSEFKRLLVDEFQDTNQAQWDIVQNLASLDDDIAMFLVGDPKQSIYSFRGADVSVFDHVRQVVGNHTRGEELDLTISFRSHPGLITAFNTLFGDILTRDDTSPVAKYEIAFDQSMTAHRTALPDPQCEHYAPIEFLIQRNVSNKRSDDFIPSDHRRIWEAHEIGKRLKGLREGQAPIHDKKTQALRAFDYGDAAILFQSTSHINTYEQVFKAMSIPFVTLAGRGYYNRQEVWDVLNLLKSLHNPADNLSLAAALRSPMFAFSDEILLALRSIKEDDGKKPIPLWNALERDDIPYLDDSQIARIRKAKTILSELRLLAGRVTISELLRTALAKTGYLATLTGLQDGARLRRNVEKLVDIAEQSGKITLGTFSHYLNDLTAREVREGEAILDTSGVVRLMTVHASKGLEFPVVVLADADWTRRGGGGKPIIYDSISHSLACKIFDENEGKHVPTFAYGRATRLQKLREEAERKRLLYVAATRARDCVIISGEMRQKKDGDWSTSGWLKTITTALELDNLDLPDGHLSDYATESKIRLNLPDYDKSLVRTIFGMEKQSPREKLTVQDESQIPPLMRPVVVEPEKMLGHIAATQLANIGGYHYADGSQAQNYYRSSVRRQILDDAAPQIRDAIRTRDPRIRPRQLGELVHEALRYWRFPDEHDNMDAVLRSYAWQQNITDENQIEDVVKRARRMLEKFQTSQLYEAISRTKANNLPYYAELPFIYRTEKRIIHGIIDALFKSGDEWWLVDYKTSTVRGGIPYIQQHAKRYYLQLGTYASAVRQELSGETPRVFVHYIQYNETVEVPAETWEAEIQKLEHYIGELVR